MTNDHKVLLLGIIVILIIAAIELIINNFNKNNHGR